MSQSSTLAAQISAQLTSKGLVPTQSWLTAFVLTQRPTTPLPALTQTALFRLLASDITTSLSPSSTAGFPTNVHDTSVKDRRLNQGPIVAQVLAIEDMSKSRWEQIQAIEALERGEGTRGREIVRVTAVEENENANARAVNQGGGPHKLLLQDVQGVRVYGIELRQIEGIGVGMSIGSKILLRNVSVARGVVLLEPGTTSILGGKIEFLHKTWRENRKAALKAAIEANERP
ncbi:hypothetical protein MMC07_001383 [Pseudocyphellaria aurata]|nr:hypothetical protein [Pseudocyphellaria aurata]